MVLKTKLSLGLGFLFAIIFALAAFCSYYVGKSAQEADNILKDNYDSIVYSRNMTSSLDDMIHSISSTVFIPAHKGAKSDYYRQLFGSGRKVFETNLKAEKNNITEIHEKEYVEKLNHDYEVYLKLCHQMTNSASGRLLYFSDFLPACEGLKQSINSIYDVNMQAVVRKSQLAKKDAANFKSAMAAIATICFLLALGYFWYFPFYISNTFSYLANRMRNLLNKIGIALDIHTNDEAFVILQAIKELEKKFGVNSTEKIVE
jgi:two-component system, NtrC family, sensor histidine kinase KinB